jgi:Reverse transcriptase (RNA-dependent DNA polymerase)
MLEEHFSDAEIVRRLSRKRAKCATMEHEHMRLEMIAPLDGGRTPNYYEAQVRKLFPPRACWTRPRERDGLTREALTAQSAFSAAMRALNSSANASVPHVLGLRAFLHDLRLAALGDEPYVFQPPEIIPCRKERGSSVYRAIGRLGLRDAVVESIAAKYLRQRFDPDFLDCALAYRCGSAGHPARTHHDAMRGVLDFTAANSEHGLWAVEIDIRKFYDSVGHDVALRAVDQAVDRAARRGVVVDPRALAIFRAFIASYSFPRNVLSEALPGLRTRDPDATFGWPGEDGALDEFYPDPMAADVGIIQGAALSCLIANLVLHDADVAVTNRKSKSQRLYLRYSDDMALMCTSKAAAKADMQKYLAAMKALHLPIHESKPDAQYGREFWREKSRGPYGFTDLSGGAPVFGFVGYQLHVAGHLRLRPSSLRKQIDRIHDETDKVVRRLLSVGRDGIRLTGQQILNLLEGRLVGMAVGRRNPGSRPGELSQNCFAAAWKLLAEHPHQRGQLRVLDRERGHSLHRLRRVLRMLRVPIDPSAGSNPRRNGGSRFLGGPFSYAGQYPCHLSLGKGPRP